MTGLACVHIRSLNFALMRCYSHFFQLLTTCRMSWTTSPPYSVKSVSSQQPTDSTAATTPPPILSPKPVPRSLAILNKGGKPRTPVAPHKLAQLANALGVATPSPGPVPYPLYSPSTPNSTSFGGSISSPSRYLLHVIPPLHLLLAEQEDANDPHVQTQFRRGTLVPLHPTLASQLGAIAREFSLPSTGGMILYLITAENDAGPRITDDAWRMLWFRALQVDRDGSVNGRTIARYHSRSTTPNGPYPSPSTTTDGQYGRLSSPSSDNTPASSVTSLDLPISFNPTAALPILAKVEFDIDRRKAPWYELWRHRRRTTSHSVASTLHSSGGLTTSASSSTRVLQLPLRARSTSPSLAEFKAKYSPTPTVNRDSPETSDADAGKQGYAKLEDDDSGRSGIVHLDEFTEDPLEDVFPSDQNTWAQIHAGNERGDVEDSPTSPHTPDVLVGGRIGSTILSLEVSTNLEETDREVIRMWKQSQKPTLDPSLIPSSPVSAASGHPEERSRSASKHVPPPLDLTASSRSQIPHVEIAPPTATSPSMKINSDLPYLDTDGQIVGNRHTHQSVGEEDVNGGSAGIRILVEGSSAAQSEASASPKLVRTSGSITGSLVGSEEARSRRLDELERVSFHHPEPNCPDEIDFISLFSGSRISPQGLSGMMMMSLLPLSLPSLSLRSLPRQRPRRRGLLPLMTTDMMAMTRNLDPCMLTPILSPLTTYPPHPEILLRHRQRNRCLCLRRRLLVDKCP